MSLNSYSQLMDGKPGRFTKADTLRGTLSPERLCYDVSYYHLDIRIDIENKHIEGANTIHFKAVNDFNKLQIDLFENMRLDRIEWRGKKLNYTRQYNAIFIEFPQTVSKGAHEEMIIYYSGNPIQAKRAPWDGGFVFSKDNDRYDWIGVACQGTGASLWWPCKDHQSDEPDSMLISVAVPSGYVNISNGRLRSAIDLKNGYTQFSWFLSVPVNTYNVTVNIGKYVHFSDEYTSKIDGEKLTLDYYVKSYHLEKAKKQFEQVKPMLDAFEKYFGKYPFYADGFKIVESDYLGMEHQSCIAYGNKYKNGYRGLDLSMTGEGMKFDYILIHEAAHEWWGNSVTASDIADMWIHEGFGQYAEVVYLEELHGKSSATKYINGLRRGVGNKEPVIGPYGVNTEGSGDMYPKGALFLHTLRNVINHDSLWWSIVKGIAEEYHHSITDTRSVMNYMNAKANRDLTKIFEQYLYYPALPKLELKYLIEKDELVLSYKWITDVQNFDMPVDLVFGLTNERLRIYPANAAQTIRMRGVEKEQVQVDTRRFYIQLEEL